MEGVEPEPIAWTVSAGDRGEAIVTLRGELDIASVDRLDAAVAPVMARRPDRLVIDVSGLRFADSSAIALWVRWASMVDEIELRDPPPLLRRVVASMGLAGKLRLTT
jgi:anti-anti-sigma factor